MNSLKALWNKSSDAEFGLALTKDVSDFLGCEVAQSATEPVVSVPLTRADVFFDRTLTWFQKCEQAFLTVRDSGAELVAAGIQFSLATDEEQTRGLVAIAHFVGIYPSQCSPSV